MFIFMVICFLIMSLSGGNSQANRGYIKYPYLVKCCRRRPSKGHFSIELRFKRQHFRRLCIQQPVVGNGVSPGDYTDSGFRHETGSNVQVAKGNIFEDNLTQGGRDPTKFGAAVQGSLSTTTNIIVVAVLRTH